jgi:predicted CXXCH cytochrome family protein
MGTIALQSRLRFVLCAVIALAVLFTGLMALGQIPGPTTLPIPSAINSGLPIWAPETSQPTTTQAGISSSTAPAVPATINPHFAKDTCNTCHVIKDNHPEPIADGLSSTKCLSCHDGTKATDEPHPIDRPLTATLNNPNWPLLDGKLQCITCHDVRQQCDPAADPAIDLTNTNPNFLRIITDAADQPKPFCASCHPPQQSQRFNPHMMLAADHKPIEERCQICHAQPMDRKATTRSGDPQLRDDQVKLCRSCHPHHKDISRTGHVLTPIKPQMLAYMRAREITGLVVMPSPDMVQQLLAQKAQPTLMVPDARGVIVCSTCHNPHQQGLFTPGCVLDDRALRLVGGHLMTSTRGATFCNHCHSF